MSALPIVSKSAIFTAGIALIVAGSNLLQSNLCSSILLIVLGIVLILIYTYYVEKQSSERALKLALEKLKTAKRESHGR